MYCWLAGCLDGWMSKARTTLATAHWSNGDDTILRLRYVGHTQYRSSDRAINRPTAVKGWARKEISLRPDLCLSLARLPRVAAQRSVPGSSTLTLPPSRMVIHRGGGGGFCTSTPPTSHLTTTTTTTTFHAAQQARSTAKSRNTSQTSSFRASTGLDSTGPDAERQVQNSLFDAAPVHIYSTHLDMHGTYGPGPRR